MASPGALYPPSACYSQLVATPVARREAHALKGGQDSLLSSPRRFCGALEPADPTTSCACSRRAVPEPPCPRKAGPHPAPEDSVQHTPTASDGSLLRTPLPATPPVAPPAPVTPHSRVFRFGSPLGSPIPAELLASGKAAGCGLKARQQSARAGVVSRVPASPRCSALLDASFIPAPPLVAMTPRLLSALRPCSVRLTGSVRLRGDEILHMPRRQLSLSFSSPASGTRAGAAAAAAAPPPTCYAWGQAAPGCCTMSAGSTGRAALSAGREPSFADLLAIPSAAAAPGVSDGASVHLPRALALATPPASLSAEMAVSPRKRARKCAAPLRAAAAEGELPVLLLLGGGEQADSEDQTAALAHCMLPRKAPRCQ